VCSTEFKTYVNVNKITFTPCVILIKLFVSTKHGAKQITTKLIERLVRQVREIKILIVRADILRSVQTTILIYNCKCNYGYGYITV
jgi:hypothetical protein